LLEDNVRKKPEKNRAKMCRGYANKMIKRWDHCGLKGMRVDPSVGKEHPSNGKKPER